MTLADGLVDAYAEAGGEAVAADLNARLQAQLSFWRETAPALHEGWWNKEETPLLDSLHARYAETFALFVALQHIRTPGAIPHG